ncbi:hypothetical protein JW905_07610, partial [bacterium]|nr:hypothetical protein [candidate division CSSED10-310 bacterium]
GFHHEIHVNRPRWDLMWELDADAVRTVVDAIWQWHVVDKELGDHNRHGDGKPGCDFAMSAGEFMYALGMAAVLTGDRGYLDKARLLADHHWRSRDPATGLIPNQPNARGRRFDGDQFDTSITGIFCYFLLKTYERTGETIFKDQALSYLRAYARYGFDAGHRKFHAALKLDGTPVAADDPAVLRAHTRGGDAAQQPCGHLDLWEPYQLGYQFPVYTAQVYAYACQLSRDPVMLEAAREWAEWIATVPPAAGCNERSWYREYVVRFSHHGTFAGLYGRSISFFIHMYALTAEREYLETARTFAREAIAKLYYHGLLRGHPAKPYYASVDGVGFLLYALLQLDRITTGSAPEPNGIPLRGPQPGIMAFDNW